MVTWHDRWGETDTRGINFLLATQLGRELKIGDIVLMLKMTKRGGYYKKPKGFTEGIIEKEELYEGALYYRVGFATPHRWSQCPGMPKTSHCWYTREGLILLP